MSACTFFGHRDAPDTLYPTLLQTIERLILQKNVTCFYVGNHGSFDRLAYTALRQTQKLYPHIRIAVVLAYMPSAKNERCSEDSLLPEGIETVPKRYAIDYRNRWMLNRSTYVISYITRGYGGAARYVRAAEKQEKIVIALS